MGSSVLEEERSSVHAIAGREGSSGQSCHGGENAEGRFCKTITRFRGFSRLIIAIRFRGSVNT
jgi:hypothetical protein